MNVRLFSTSNRPVHLGPYPLERLSRSDEIPDLSLVPTAPRVSFERPDVPESVVNAMSEYQAMLDVIRIGLVAKSKSACPEDLNERAEHLKSFGYFSDASMVGICELPDQAILDHPHRNPDVARLAEVLRTQQTKTLSSGIDVIMADLKETVEAPECPRASYP